MGIVRVVRYISRGGIIGAGFALILILAILSIDESAVPKLDFSKVVTGYYTYLWWAILTSFTISSAAVLVVEIIVKFRRNKTGG